LLHLEHELEKYELVRCIICGADIETQEAERCDECGKNVCCGYAIVKDTYLNEEGIIFCYDCLLKFPIDSPETLPDEDAHLFDDYWLEEKITPKTADWKKNLQ